MKRFISRLLFAVSVAAAVMSCDNKNNGTTITLSPGDLYEAARVYGIYTYDGTSWTREDSSDKLEFRFDTEEGKKVVATVQASTGGSEVSIDGKTECAITVNTQCNFGSNVDVNISLNANGYVITESLNVNSGSGSCNIDFSIDGESIVSAASTFGGNHLTDPDYIYENYETIGGNASAVVSILTEAQLKGSCSDISAMVRELDNLEWDSSIESARQEAAIYNKYITAGLTYDNATNFVAELEVVAYEYDEYSFYTEPIIVFTSDGSRFSLEDYFTEENFGGLIDSFENLYNVYASYIDAGEEEVLPDSPNMEM